MKTVLITGASGGIGGEIAKKFARNGYHLCLGYHKNESAALTLKGEIEDMIAQSGGSNEIMIFSSDISNYDEANSMVEACIDRFDKIDVLVNNAGISLYKLFTDMDEKDWDMVMNVNLKSVFNMSRHVLKYMLPEKSGAIINISSIWGLTGACMEVAYSSSKAGVDGLTKALAKELGPSNIRVNSVACGVIDTPMNARFSKEEIDDLVREIPLMRLGRPCDVADAVFFLAEDAGFITGEILNVTGGHYC